jgi:DNA excision repair protein ERCC-2
LLLPVIDNLCRLVNNNGMDNNGQVIRIAVRTLAESVHQSGGLAGPAYSGVDAAAGVRLHQHFFRQLTERHREGHVQSEVALSLQSQISVWLFMVSGRCDALVELPEGPPCLIEAKSFAGPSDQLPAEGEKVHWAQACLYGWMYLSGHPDLAGMRIGLAYLALDGNDLIEKEKYYSRQDLALFFQTTCQSYIDFAGNQILGRGNRLASGIGCPFPYSGLRAGQKRFMQEVIGTARQKGAAFIQAPTGTGKTMAALYPAVKVVANRIIDHVFYLTAMTSTRQVAARAIEDLRQAGLTMKYIVLYAKEKLCLAPELFCDSRQCPFATAYYDHLPDALRQLFLLESIGQAEIVACAVKHRVCPFELSLDMSLYCEIIICDYNYAFDPRVRLVRFFGDEPQTHLLLVDEAHNLPARSREMFSATIDSTRLDTAWKSVREQSLPLDRCFERLRDYFALLAAALITSDPALDKVEAAVKPASVMIAERFRACRDLPSTLLSLLYRFGFQCRQFLDRPLPARVNNRPLLDFYFDALFFCRVTEEFYDETYITSARLEEGRLEIQLMCLDASEKLAKTYRHRHPTVFFSATLSPLAYYMGLLHSRHPDVMPEQLLLGSPFPPENLLVLVCSRFSTRYRLRRDTAEAILDLILAASRQKIGNYLVFVPSFAYLEMVRGLLRGRTDLGSFDWMFQSRGMSEAMRLKYLRRFEQFGNKTLVAIAVIGGLFAEGIDLAGERLAGVVIVGVGLPQICPEREIMRQYYGEVLGSGYEYAYLFPGFNKVQQAAGRVIRSENDRGFVLLIDDRYETPSYTELFPSEWQAKLVEDAGDLALRLREFWDQSPSFDGI